MTSLCANHSTRKQQRGGGGQYSTLTGRGRRTVRTISQSGQRVWTAAAETAAAYYVRRHVALPLGPDTVIDRVSVAVPSTRPALLCPLHTLASSPVPHLTSSLHLRRVCVGSSNWVKFCLRRIHKMHEKSIRNRWNWYQVCWGEEGQC